MPCISTGEGVAVAQSNEVMRREAPARAAAPRHRARCPRLDLGELLGREHRTERRNRHFDLVDRRLPRGELLEQQARLHESAHPCPLHVLRGEADELVAQTGDERDQHHARADQQHPSRPAHERVDDDRHDHHRQQEVGPAAHVRGTETLADSAVTATSFS